MQPWIVLCLIFIPPCVALFFYGVLAVYNDVPKYFGKERFTVYPPAKLLWCSVGFFGFAAALLYFLYPFQEPICAGNSIEYLCVFIFVWVGSFALIAHLRYRIVVDGDKMTVYPYFSKAYTVTFDEIILVHWQKVYVPRGGVVKGVQLRTKKHRLSVTEKMVACEQFKKKVFVSVDISKQHGENPFFNRP